MKYTIKVKAVEYAYVDVEAKNEQEAKSKATEAAEMGCVMWDDLFIDEATVEKVHTDKVRDHER